MASNSIATAWVSVKPSLEGIGKNLTKGFNSSGATAGINASLTNSLAKGGLSAGQSFSNSLGGSIKKLAPMLAGIGIAGAIGKLVGEVSEGTKAIRVGTGATGEALKGLQTVAQNSMGVVGSSFVESSQMVADFNTRTGLVGGQLEDLVNKFGRLQKLTGENIDINTLTAGLTGAGVKAEDMSSALDGLYNASQSTGVGISELSTTMKTNGGVLQSLNIDVGSAAQMLGVMDKAGINSSGVLTQLQKNLPIEAAKAGVSNAELFTLKMEELRTAVGGGQMQKAQEILKGMFGAKLSGQLITSLTNGTLSVDELAGHVSVGTDTINSAFLDSETPAENFQRKLKEMEAQAIPLGITLTTVAGKILESVGGLTKWAGEHQSITNALIGITAGIGAVVGAIKVYGVAVKGIAFIQGVFTAISTAMGLLRTSTILATAAQAIYNAVLAVNPIILIIAGIAALILGIVLLIKNFDKVKNAVINFANKAKEVIGGFIGMIRDKFMQVLQFVINLFNLQQFINLGGDIIRGIAQGVINLKDWVIGKIKEVAAGMVNGVKNFLGIHSPSKVFNLIGQNCGYGLAEGIDASEGKVLASAEKLAETSVKKFEEGIRKNKPDYAKLLKIEQSELSKISENLRNDVIKAYQPAFDDLADQLKTAKDNLATALSEISQTADKFKGELDFKVALEVSAEGVMPNNREIGAKIMELTAAKAAQLQNFAKWLKELAGDGFPSAILNEVAGLGAENGILVAQALHSLSFADKNTMIKSFGDIDKWANKIGTTLYNSTHELGVNALKGIVAGLKKEQSTLIKEVEKIADNMVKTFKKKWGIKSPSKVMAKQGEQLVAGVNVGINKKAVDDINFDGLNGQLSANNQKNNVDVKLPEYITLVDQNGSLLGKMKTITRYAVAGGVI